MMAFRDSLLPQGVFTVRRSIRFSDCDPAGIVFYVAFFRMFNDLFEDWMIRGLGVDFADQFFEEEHMFPLMHVEADFKQARRMGQSIDLSLILTKLGRSSIHYDIVGHDDGLEILRGALVNCVASKRTMASIEIPERIRSKMEAYLSLCRG